MKFSSVIFTLSLFLGPSAMAKDDEYVLRYKNDIGMEEALDLVEEAGAYPKKQLSCSRGLVVNVHEENLEGRELLESSEGFKLVPMNETPHAKQGERRMMRALAPDKECQCEGDYGGGEPEVDENDVDLIIAKFRNLVADADDGTVFDREGEPEVGDDIRGAMLRLAFHDRASLNKVGPHTLDGFNSCLDLNHGGNFGLEEAVQQIKDIQAWAATPESGIEKYVSRSDVTAIVGLAVLLDLYDNRVADDAGRTPPRTSPLLPSYTLKLGRIDILEETCDACETTFLPGTEGDAAIKLNEFHDVMFHRIGFEPKMTAALLGTHAFGRMKEEHTGYNDNPWTIGSQSRLSNSLFSQNISVHWIKKVREVGGNIFTEWVFPSRITDGCDTTGVQPFPCQFDGPHRAQFLNVDALLCWDIDDETCDTIGGIELCDVNDDGEITEDEIFTEEDPAMREICPVGRGGPIFPNTCTLLKDVKNGPFTGLKKQYGKICMDYVLNEQHYIDDLFDAYMALVDGNSCGELYVAKEN